jgi:thiol-disulfide isomerase/thioredoxin
MNALKFIYISVTLASALLAPFSAIAMTCDGKAAPEITGETWLNSTPLSLTGLRNKVVMVEFWTLGCSNCRNVEPYVKEWHAKYASQGLVVVGVHTPEFSYEKNLDNVREYIEQHRIRHAVVIDNDFTIWNRYANRYWPTLYLIDKTGTICAVKIGEGSYEDTERKIRQLLAES